MPVYTEAGLQPRSLTDYVDDLTAAFRSVLGSDMSTAAESPQSQIIGALAIELARLDEEVLSAAAGMSLFTSAGRQLDVWGELLGIARRAATHSTVMLTLTGSPSVIVPAGSRVETATGAIFATDSDVIILPGGSVQVAATSTEPGTIIAPAGTITTLIDVIAGWAGVDNAADAIPGSERESDTEYRLRYAALSSAHARDGLASIRARLLATAGVLRARLEDNPTASAITRQGVSIPAYSILAIVQGGTDRAVAESIAATKPVGIPTTGSTTVSNVDPGDNDILFSRVVLTRVLVAMTLDIGPLFPSDGIHQIQSRVVDWSVGAWPSDGTGEGLGIGETVAVSRLYSPINSVPGHEVTALTVTDALGGALPSTPPLTTLYTIAEADVSVTIV